MKKYNLSNILFALTPGFTIDKWKRLGILERELISYKHHIKSGGGLTILECNKWVKTLVRYEDNIQIIRIPHLKILKLLPFFKSFMNQFDLIKTNQTFRADEFVKLGIATNKPVLLRCGYVGGEYYESIYGLTNKTKEIQNKESWAFKNCTFATVPTQELKNWICEKYKVNDKKIIINPNFVDMDHFKNTNRLNNQKIKICTVGRLVDVKRIDMLIKACRNIKDIQLGIIGDGPEREKLESLSSKYNLSIKFYGTISYNALPEILRSYNTYVICSKREGHPKSLIEAMSMTLACLGTDSNGINNIINRENGLLVDNSILGIKNGIIKLKNNLILREELGEKARSFIKNKYSLKKYIEREKLLLKKISE